jgi:hypothetical protein
MGVRGPDEVSDAGDQCQMRSATVYGLRRTTSGRTYTVDPAERCGVELVGVIGTRRADDPSERTDCPSMAMVSPAATVTSLTRTRAPAFAVASR